MNSEGHFPNCNVGTGDLRDTLNKVVLFECDEASLFARFERADTWIGKIPCSAVKPYGKEATRRDGRPGIPHDIG